MSQNSQKTALLVMDMQTAILSSLPGNLFSTVTENASKAIAHARQSDIPVIFVRVGFRSGAPEISMNNKTFAAGKERFQGEEAQDFLKIDPSVEPEHDDIVVTKRRVSAFTGSDLEVLLRAQEIQHIVLSGVATSGVVLSTLRQAADIDFQITVLSDCCADSDEEVHRILTEKIFPSQASVKTVGEWG